jgi:hypothetical protein
VVHWFSAAREEQTIGAEPQQAFKQGHRRWKVLKFREK